MSPQNHSPAYLAIRTAVRALATFLAALAGISLVYCLAIIAAALV